MTETTGDPAQQARDHLDTIRKGWRHVLDPIRVESGGSVQTGIRPATEDELEVPPDAKLDTPTTLAFWVHAAVDEWPGILDRPQRIPQPTTDPSEYAEWTIRMETITVDCSSIYEMCDLLTREAARLTSWVDESGHDFGSTFLDEVQALARAVARVAWPPKGDRMVIGDCPACLRRLRIKAPAWRQDEVPQPTTDPSTYPAWTVLPGATWRPERDKPIACRCGKEDTFDGWRTVLAGPSLAMTAEQLVEDIRQQFGVRYQPLSVRTWARRGLIAPVDHKGPNGRARYDRTQVLAMLMARERAAMDERIA